MRASAQTGSIAYFSEADLQRLARHPGVARADFSRFAKLQLDPGRAQVTLVVRPFDVDDAGAELPLTGAVVRWTPDMPPPIWITEAMVEIYGMQPGRVVELPLAGRLQRFMPVGVWRDYARQFGAVAMRTEDYQAATGDNTITDAALWLKPGWIPTRVAEDLRAEMDARRRDRVRAARRHPQAQPADLRPQLRGDLRARDRRHRDRPDRHRRDVLVAGDRPHAGVRDAAPHRAHPRPDPRPAGDRRRPGHRARDRRRTGAPGSWSRWC